MKEYIVTQTIELEQFGNIWKKYEPTKELVRCRDCKLRDECELAWQMCDPEWFCADGSRK